MPQWIRTDAERGNPAAQVDLGLAYVAGTVVPKDYIEASKWFRRAAEQGEVGGQFNLGLMYYLGDGVPRDYAEAEKWLTKAAEQDHTAAQFNVGLMHLKGQGVAQSYEEAVKWFRTPAEQGFAVAQFNLGFLYFHGNGVPQSQGEAVKWFSRAAEQGELSSQCMLGAIYSEENGAEQDYVQAHRWLNICATSGKGDKQQTAAKLLDEISQKMTPQQIQEAEQQTIDWVDARGNKVNKDVYLSGEGVAPPVAIENPAPPYTDKARAAGISGRIVVACIVRTTGNVDSCEIQRGLGYGLDESAINTIETKWRFQPGRILRRPVDIFARIQITFKPN